MRRFTTILAGALCAVSLTACGDSNPSGSAGATVPAPVSDAAGATHKTSSASGTESFCAAKKHAEQVIADARDLKTGSSHYTTEFGSAMAKVGQSITALALVQQKMPADQRTQSAQALAKYRDAYSEVLPKANEAASAGNSAAVDRELATLAGRFQSAYVAFDCP
jgi:hypothetical protein